MLNKRQKLHTYVIRLITHKYTSKLLWDDWENHFKVTKLIRKKKMQFFFVFYVFTK